MPCEITVRMKDKQTSLTVKEVYYCSVEASMHDSSVNEMIVKAKKDFNGDPLKINVTLKLID